MLWIPLTLAAAFLQNLRSLLQKRLAGTLSVNAASYVRFCYALPFAWIYLMLLVADASMPPLNGRFWLFCVVGALAQIVATALLLSAFTLRSFAVSTALSKTEVVQAMVLGFVLLGDAVTPLAALGIGISLVGVLLLSGGGALHQALANRRALLLGLLAGTGLALAVVGYRGAALALGQGDALLRAAVTLAVALGVQTVVMGGYLVLREPGQLRRVAAAWRAGVWVGACGAAASAGWFTAMALQTSALVRALGQAELLFAVLTSWWVFREGIRPRELAGMTVLVAGILLLLS